MEQKNLMKEFLNKSWGLWGLNKLLQKLQETRRQDEAAALKAYRIPVVFPFCNICTQIEYYAKGISHLFANFLSFNNTKHY